MKKKLGEMTINNAVDFCRKWSKKYKCCNDCPLFNTSLKFRCNIFHAIGNDDLNMEIDIDEKENR